MGQDTRFWFAAEQERRDVAGRALIAVLKPYMELRKLQGIGHMSREGKALAKAWDDYVKIVQPE